MPATGDGQFDHAEPVGAGAGGGGEVPGVVVVDVDVDLGDCCESALPAVEVHDASDRFRSVVVDVHAYGAGC